MRPNTRAQRICEMLVSLPDVFLASDMLDGQTLTGTEWIVPDDYATQEVERHDLPSLKGMTDTELPVLERTE